MLITYQAQFSKLYQIKYFPYDCIQHKTIKFRKKNLKTKRLLDGKA